MDSSTTATADHQLLDAFESGDFQTALQLLPNEGPLITIGPEGFTPLHYACRHGEAEVARLHIAAKYGHIDALRVLVDKTSISECGNDVVTPNITTTCISDISCLRDEDGNTPLHTAAAYGQLAAAQYLIRDLQCNPTCTNLKKETPLHPSPSLPCLLPPLLPPAPKAGVVGRRGGFPESSRIGRPVVSSVVRISLQEGVEAGSLVVVAW